MIVALSILICFLTGLVWVLLMQKTALRFNIVDKPDNVIKLHTKVTPYLGGVGFIMNMFMMLGLYLLITGIELSVKELWILGLTACMLILGIIDDIRRIRPLTKFIFQCLFAGVLIFAGIRLDIMYLPDWANYLLTLLWITGISNAFNLIDIMDGLCGGVAMIAGFFLFFSTQSMYMPLLFLALSLLSFLVYNFPPAKIFMGDAGSLSIGFMFSAYAVIGSYTENNRIGLLAPLLILWLPIYETILVSILRIKKGKNPFHGSKDHFAFRLKAAGFPVIAVLFVSYFLSIIMGETAFLAVTMPFDTALIVYSITALFFVVLFFVLSKIKID